MGQAPEILAQTGTDLNFSEPAYFPDPAEVKLQGFEWPARNEQGALAFTGAWPRRLRDARPGGASLHLATDPASRRLTSHQTVGGFDEFLHTTFRRLGDPVLAAGDAGMAFQASTDDGILRRLAKRALWWQQPQQFAKPVAAIGAEARGMPGKRWRAFDSLAIVTSRGPLFSAKVDGAAQGVWAVDLEGELRLLFRTGQKLEGKEVRQFTLLNALPGSTGVTRSFNERGQVAWRAMLSGGGQALVVTQAP